MSAALRILLIIALLVAGLPQCCCVNFGGLATAFWPAQGSSAGGSAAGRIATKPAVSGNRKETSTDLAAAGCPHCSDRSTGRDAESRSPSKRCPCRGTPRPRHPKLVGEWKGGRTISGNESLPIAAALPSTSPASGVVTFRRSECGIAPVTTDLTVLLGRLLI